MKETSNYSGPFGQRAVVAADKIRSAAPDLLAACKAAREALIIFGNQLPVDSQKRKPGSLLEKTRRVISAAITKAEGTAQ